MTDWQNNRRKEGLIGEFDLQKGALQRVINGESVSNYACQKLRNLLRNILRLVQKLIFQLKILLLVE